MPESPTDVTIEFISGDNDISIDLTTPITFNNSNWDSAQTIEFSSETDDDTIDGMAVFQLQGNNVTGTEVIVTEIDNDHFAVTGTDGNQAIIMVKRAYTKI